LYGIVGAERMLFVSTIGGWWMVGSPEYDDADMERPGEPGAEEGGE
jgi:hypothetical protein